MIKKRLSFKERLDQLFESLSPSVGSTAFPDPSYLDPKSIALTQRDRSDEEDRKQKSVLDPDHSFVPSDMFGSMPDSGMPSSVGVMGNTPPRSDTFIPGRSERIIPNIDPNAFDSAGESEDDEIVDPTSSKEFDYLVCVKCQTKPCTCSKSPIDISSKSTFGGYDNKLDPKGSRNKYWHEMGL